MSQRHLAAALGYHKSYIGHVEHGRHPITSDFAARFLSSAAAIQAGIPAVQVMAIADPNGFVDGTIILRPSRECACGCGAWFIPNAHNHKFLPRHRRHGR